MVLGARGADMARRGFWPALRLARAGRRKALLGAIPSQSAARHSSHHRRRRSLAPPPPAQTPTLHVCAPLSSACRRDAWLAACTLVLLGLAAGGVDAKPFVHKGIKRVSIVFACHLDVVRPRWRGSRLLAAGWLAVGAPEAQCSLSAPRAAAHPRNPLPTVDPPAAGLQLRPAGHPRL